MTTKLVYNRKGQLDATGSGLVQLRITLGQKTKYVSSGVRVKPVQWDERKQKIKNHPNVINLNIILSKIEQRALSYYSSVLAKNEKPSVGRIAEYARSGSIEEETANLFFWDVYGRRTGKLNTLKQHKLLLSYLDQFSNNIHFSDLNYTFLVEFEGWLLNRDNYRGGKFSRNYVSSLLRIFRIYVHEAIKHQRLTVNPFLGFTIATEASEIEHLTLSEVEKIELVNVDDRRGYISETKLMFLFCCYTSLRFSDVCLLQGRHIKETPEGLILEKKPEKTKKSKAKHFMNLSQLFWGRPAEIVKGLIGKDHNFIFGPHDPDTYNSTYNDHLRVIAERAGIDKKVTSHVARHTCAMVLLNELNFPIEDVSTIMAHSDITITQRYARVRYDRLDRMIREKFK